MAPDTPLHDADTLRRVIATVRRRYRLRLLLRGAVVLVVGAFLALLLSAWALEQTRFDDTAVTAVRIAFYVVLGGLVLRAVVLPLARRLPDERVALYLEEHEPSLGAALVSAVEHAGSAHAAPPGTSPALVRRLVHQAVERARAVEEGRRVEQRPLAMAGAMLAAGLAVAAIATLAGPEALRHALRVVATPWSDARAAAPYAVAVTPGNTVLARGGDVRIAARLHGFATDEARLLLRRAGESEWETLPMAAGAAAGEFALRLFDLDRSAEYFVEANGVRSGVYRLDVRDLPAVRRLALELRFPAYTGLPPQQIEEGGDVAAPRGTVVRARIVPTMPTTGGELVVEGRAPAPLAPDSGGTLAGEFTVEREGFYKVRLRAADGTLVDASLDYLVEVLPDRAPSVEIVRPGRDERVTPIEEVFVEARAEDDFGVGRLELVYRVNGGEERTVRLGGSTRDRVRREVSGTHTLYLEELELVPGDVISYYARAVDGEPGRAKRAETDIYFMTVRPFGREYRQAEQGGGGGGGEGPMPEGLSRQQREVIAATHKAQRDRAATPAAELRENLATITLAQGRLREQVETLARRLGERGIATSDSTFATIAEELPKAAEAMREAEDRLGRRDPAAALPPEERALQHLLRAEAAFREVQVAMGTPEQAGGGGMSDAEELADLFELEVDRMRNQYETVQRGREDRQRQEVDEVLERLKELASRQQRENERRLRQQESMGSAASGAPRGGGDGAAQREIAEEAERLARQLERLTRDGAAGQDPELERSARRLQQAADAMRRAAAEGRDTDAQGRAALERLEEARRLLDRDREAGVARRAQEAAERARRLAQEQRRIAGEAGRLSPGDDAGRRRLEARKEAQAGEVGALEEELDRLARDARGEQREGARRLQAAADGMRERRLRERIEYSRQLLGRGEASRRFEEDIAAALGELGARVDSAARAMGERPDARREQALERTRELAQGLESLAERMREQGRDGNSEGRPQEGRQREGQPGQQQQGQQPSAVGQQPNMPPGAATSSGDARPGQGGAPRQLARELRQRRMDAEALRRDLATAGIDPAELEGAIDALRGLERTAPGDMTATAEQLLTDVVEDLKAFEFAARRALEGDPADTRPRAVRPDEVPPGWREVVERYYEELAR